MPAVSAAEAFGGEDLVAVDGSDEVSIEGDHRRARNLVGRARELSSTAGLGRAGAADVDLGHVVADRRLAGQGTFELVPRIVELLLALLRRNVPSDSLTGVVGRLADGFAHFGGGSLE